MRPMKVWDISGLTHPLRNTVLKTLTNRFQLCVGISSISPQGHFQVGRGGKPSTNKVHVEMNATIMGSAGVLETMVGQCWPMSSVHSSSFLSTKKELVLAGNLHMLEESPAQPKKVDLGRVQEGNCCTLALLQATQ